MAAFLATGAARSPKPSESRARQPGSALNSSAPKRVRATKTTWSVRAAHTAAQKGDSDSIDWHALATTALYRRKRASTLADLIRARGTLKDLGAPDPASVERALGTGAGLRALEVALRRIKQTVLASHVMELITCGAVPPYREVLGGKLVALLMLSRTVAEDYERKYTGQVSLIASGLAARPVVRPAQLAWLTTSSLYAIGSSQYNRLKLSMSSGVLSYERIGVTQSFGTVHFAPDTIVVRSTRARVSPTRIAGVSTTSSARAPAPRCVSCGPDSRRSGSTPMSSCATTRRGYSTAPTCARIFPDLLIGLSETPKYVMPAGPASTAILIDHWRERWLARRLQRADICERVAEHRVDDFLLGRDPAVRDGGFDGRRADFHDGEEYAPYRASATSDDATFVERLYRSTKSYADRLDQDELNAISRRPRGRGVPG